MRCYHAVFGYVEEVVQEVLVPCWCMGGGEGAQARGEEIHVQEGYLGPGVEGGREAECLGEEISTHIRWFPRRAFE